MFVEDIRNDFYNFLLGRRVLLLVHYDVDAICSCKILQSLFKCDNISYTLVPVHGVSELKQAYDENNEEIKYVILINCGGTVDLVEILQPEEDVVFFVLDSHKPTDVCNVYSAGQVRLVYKDNEENIPNFDDIFTDDEDENETLENRLDALEAAVEKKRKRRTWEERRNTLMFNYTQFSYYGRPSACVVLELAWRLSRRGASALWAGCVALAAHEALHLRSPAQCVLDAASVHARLANEQPAECTARVVLEKDVWLPLYRSWSVEAALSHAPSLAPTLRLHTAAGATRLRQLLADIGFPLQQARQAYRSMDVELRHTFLEAIETTAPKHSLPACARAAFLLRRPHCPPLAAHDLVYAVMALIESDSLPSAEGFQKALTVLEIEGECSEALSMARARLGSVARLCGAVLAARQLHLAGPFSYFVVNEGAPDASAVSGPLWLGVAARWLALGSARGGSRPVVGSAPKDERECWLLGVPPRYDQEPRNLFGAAFEQAASRCGASVSLEYPDSSVVSLPVAQRTMFLDALTALLA